MNILLINDNPLVAGLLRLCTRDAEIFLDEARGVTDIKEKAYDVIIVDEAVYTEELLGMNNHMDISMKIFFSQKDEKKEHFDITIKKPFSPLQIITILQDIGIIGKKAKSAKLEEHTSSEKKTLRQDVGLSEAMDKGDALVLDMNELRKIQELLEMTDEIVDQEARLSPEEIEIRKRQVITEQLIAEGLEIVSEETIVDGLELQPMKKGKKNSLAYNENERESIEDAISVAIATLKPNKLKKLLKGKKVKFKIQLEGKA